MAKKLEGKHYKEARDALGLTQENVSEQTGANTRTIARIENGEVDIDNSDTARKYAAMLGLDISDYRVEWTDLIADPHMPYTVAACQPEGPYKRISDAQKCIAKFNKFDADNLAYTRLLIPCDGSNSKVDEGIAMLCELVDTLRTGFGAPPVPEGCNRPPKGPPYAVRHAAAVTLKNAIEKLEREGWMVELRENSNEIPTSEGYDGHRFYSFRARPMPKAMLARKQASAA
jgi:DNA-binding XRE family transcriptional regulator